MIDPVKINTRIKTLSATQPSAHGKVRAIPSCESVKSAAVPPIRIPSGFSSDLIARMRSSAAVVRELIDGITCTRISLP